MSVFEEFVRVAVWVEWVQNSLQSEPKIPRTPSEVRRWGAFLTKWFSRHDASWRERTMTRHNALSRRKFVMTRFRALSASCRRAHVKLLSHWPASYLMRETSWPSTSPSTSLRRAHNSHLVDDDIIPILATLPALLNYQSHLHCFLSLLLIC